MRLVAILVLPVLSALVVMAVKTLRVYKPARNLSLPFGILASMLVILP